MCGELAQPDADDRGRLGSSPRVRRTPGSPVCRSRSSRFIPACAGNSAPRPSAGRRPSVHPRVCGELVVVARWRDGKVRFIPACAGNSGPWARSQTSSRGSSPRVRGTRRHQSAAHRRRRFIPACAGNSDDHVRGAGEILGSSPRVRGTHADRRQVPRRQRFIPACAGNSAGRREAGLVRGGSSPRVRGTRHRRHADAALCRFIPACAGNSCAGCVPSPQRPVHPRVCGELSSVALPLVRLDGSSPRVRGTQQRGAAAGAAGRFIPACAGNSSQAPSVRKVDPVHPRVCGEL